MFDLGDLVCDKAHTVVGVICDRYKEQNTINVLWNDVPEYQGCKQVVLHNDVIELLPQGTQVTKHFKYGTTDTILYNFYDSEKGLIKDITGSSFDTGSDDLEFEFVDDVSTKNNKQYTTLDIEPWDIINDITKDKRGFEKLYCDMVLYQVLSYATDKDKTRLNKIEKYLMELINEVSTKEI